MAFVPHAHCTEDLYTGTELVSDDKSMQATVS